MMNGAGSAEACFGELSAVLAQPGVEMLYVDGKWAARLDPSAFPYNTRLEIAQAVAAMNGSPVTTTIEPEPAAAQANDGVCAFAAATKGAAQPLREASELLAIEPAQVRAVDDRVLCLYRRSVIAEGNHCLDFDGRLCPVYAIEFENGNVLRSVPGVTSFIYRRPRRTSDLIVAVWYGDERFEITDMGDPEFDVIGRVSYHRNAQTNAKADTNAAALSSLICRAEGLLNEMRELKARL